MWESLPDIIIRSAWRAQVVTPIVSGWLMNHISYETLFPYSITFVILALLTMQFVKHGDNKVETKKGWNLCIEE